MSEDARLRHWLLSKGRVIACAAVSGSVAGYWFIRATPGWPTESTVLRILCPDPLLRPLVVTLPAIHISHEWFTARYGKKSSGEYVQSLFSLDALVSWDIFPFPLPCHVAQLLRNCRPKYPLRLDADDAYSTAATDNTTKQLSVRIQHLAWESRRLARSPSCAEIGSVKFSPATLWKKVSSTNNTPHARNHSILRSFSNPLRNCACPRVEVS